MVIYIFFNIYWVHPSSNSFSLAFMVASLQDSPQWSVPCGTHTLIETHSTLDQGWFVWWIAYGRSNDQFLQSSGFKRFHFQSRAVSLVHFLSHSHPLFPYLSPITCHGGIQLPDCEVIQTTPGEVHTTRKKSLQGTISEELGPLPEMVAILANILTTTLWETLNQNHPDKQHPDSWLSETVLSVYCVKLLNFGCNFYIALEKQKITNTATMTYFLLILHLPL